MVFFVERNSKYILHIILMLITCLYKENKKLTFKTELLLRVGIEQKENFKLFQNLLCKKRSFSGSNVKF